jgi:DNA-binding CsgD family transcriptional regulator
MDQLVLLITIVDDPAPSMLTRRERQVVRLLALGRTVAQVARACRLAVSTVRRHRRRVMTKTGSSTSVELQNYARQAGLVG